VVDSIDAPEDDEAPTRLQRPPRVQLHPKLDPRRIPTQRRLAVVRPIAAPPGDPDLPPLSRRGGVSLTWVVAFIAAAYLSILFAVISALR
jgi:hypothetical protein